MFEAILIKPIFNVLVIITALLPGHNFGIAIILFTILARLLMWPLVRKQLHHAKAMRALQPELKRIKKAAKGNRQKESMLMMELYKERNISPFGMLGLVVVQLPLFIALFTVVRRVVADPNVLVTHSYVAIQKLGWIKDLGAGIAKFDNSLFGLIDLNRAAIPRGGSVYIPALIIAIASAILQYLQSKQLLPGSMERKTLRQILREAGNGKQADQGEVNAAVSRSTSFILPALILFITVGYPAALSLYFLTNSAVAYAQQSVVLRQDTTEMEAQVGGKKATAEIIKRPSDDTSKRPRKRKK